MRNAILDGEIVHLDASGVPQFYDLMRRRRPQHYFAFDLLWLNGCDQRQLPLLERKRRLRRIVPPQPAPVLYVDHVAERGVELFDAVCAHDMEGIVAKLANAPYTPEATTWVKIKNRAYSQVEGRADFLKGGHITRRCSGIYFARRRALRATLFGGFLRCVSTDLSVLLTVESRDQSCSSG